MGLACHGFGKASPHTQAGPQRPQRSSTWVCFVMAVAGRSAHPGRPKEPPEALHMGLACHGSCKASPHMQAGPQRPQRSSTWVCFVMAVAGRPAHPGRPKEPPESLHMGLLCHGAIRQPHTQAGPHSPQRGSIWACFVMALQGRGTPRSRQGYSKGVSLGVPGGPNHAQGNWKGCLWKPLAAPHRPPVSR